MSKITELTPILGSQTESNDLFVTVSIKAGDEGTSRITRRELVAALSQETFDGVGIRNATINTSSMFDSNIFDSSFQNGSISQSSLSDSTGTNITLTESTISQSNISESSLLNITMQGSIVSDSTLADVSISQSTMVDSDILESQFVDGDIINSKSVDLELLNPEFDVTTPYTPDLDDDSYFVIKDVIQGETVKITFGELQTEIARTLEKATKIYVDSSVDVSGNGSYYKPFKTLEEAFDKIQDTSVPVSISVLPGDYITKGNLSLPDRCSVVSTSGQYATNIIMESGFEEENCFLVGSGCYIQGFNFRNQRVDDLDEPTKGFAVAFRPGSLILRSPYIRDISQTSNYLGEKITAPLDPENANPLVGKGGGTLLVDRAVLNQNSIFPYMLAFAATPRSPNGLGYVAKNGAGINGFSSVTVFQRCAFYALRGGQITLNNSGTQFGDISMRAKGSTPVVDPYEISITPLKDEDVADIISNNTNTIIDNMWDYLITVSGYDPVDVTESSTRRDANNLLKALSFDFQVGGQNTTRNFVAGLFNYKAKRVFIPTDEYDYDMFYENVEDIIDAIAHDGMFNSNFKTIRSVTSLFTTREIDVSEIDTMKTIIERLRVLIDETIVSNDMKDRVELLFDIIVDVLDTGISSVPSYVFSDPLDYDSGFENARTAIKNNKDFIVDELVAWVNDRIDNEIDPFGEGFTFDEAKYRVGIERFIDSLLYDLTYDGNSETQKISTQLFIDSLFFSKYEKIVSRETMDYFSLIVRPIVEGTIIPTSPNNTTDQDVSFTPGSNESIAFLETRIQDFVSPLIRRGRSSPSLQPSLSWVDSLFISEFNAIKESSISNTNIVFEEINTDNNTLLGSFLESYDFIMQELLDLIEGYEIENSVDKTDSKEMLTALFEDIIKKTLIGPKRLSFGSLIESLSHQFNLAGSGVNKNALPLNFRKVGRSNAATRSVLQEEGGRVRWSGSDELNNQYFARGLRINGRSGRIEGRPFTSSVRRLARRAANSRTTT